MKDELRSLYDWFDLNRNEIIKNNEGKFVLLKDNSVLGYYQTQNNALKDAESKGLKYGEFLVQWCVSESEECKMFYNVAWSIG